MEPTVDLTIPARPGAVHIARSVISSVAARLPFGYEEIDDLRLAVDEACAHLLEAQPAPERIRVTIAVSDDGIEVTAMRDVAAERWPPTGARLTLAWQVLNALTDEARFDSAELGPAIRFSKRCSTAGV